MSHSRYVFLPSGMRYNLYDPEDKDRCRVVNDVLMTKWAEYCNSNWLSDNHEAIDAPEKKVKRFLDGCADFILYCNADGVESDYKKMKTGEREIPMSACTSHMDNLVFSVREKVDAGHEASEFKQTVDELLCEDKTKAGVSKPRQRKFSKKPDFEKLQAIKKKLHIVDMRFCTVDTYGEFAYKGSIYHIASWNQTYAPKQVGEDDLYDCDRIVVAITADGEYHYFDPWWNEVPAADIILCTE